MERRPLNRRALLALALGVVLTGALVVAWRLTRADPTEPPTIAEQIKRVVPEGVRIRVEVLNATTTRGLARRATLYLRDLGFDVVRFAGDSARRDSVVILDRSVDGHPEWSQMLVKSLGAARVELRPDSARYVDFTVLIGNSWRPPTKPFYP